MGCAFHPNCGGCPKRDLSLEQYRVQKEQSVRNMLEQKLGDLSDCFEPPVFLPDGLRRRAAFAFEMKNNHLMLGFNKNKSHIIENLENCMMLHPKINHSLSVFRDFLEAFCKISSFTKGKGKKISEQKISKGDFLVLAADNGLDVVLEASTSLLLEHRMEISDFVNRCPDVIRFSFRLNHQFEAETIVQKNRPYVMMGEAPVFVAAGDFLQPSKEGENALSALVSKYVGNEVKTVADLFCGIGTFSYRLAQKTKAQIFACDISRSLLEEFRRSVNQQMMTNIQVEEKNLFQYPLTAKELEKFEAVVLDPPRAGAKAQIKEIGQCLKPLRIVYVSCAPQSFVSDALILKQGGYKLQNITLVDQFVYSAHSELVSLWTNEK